MRLLQLPELRPEHDEHARRVVVVTVALRRPSPMIAISPKKSPGPSVPSSLPFDVTTALPAAITKNE
jgi:hypothetical protein